MTNGIGHIYIETHNWDRTIAFWQAMGFRLTEETNHHSGRLDPPGEGGPYLFVNEVAVDKPPTTQIYLEVGAGVDLEGPASETHWGTREREVRDPDGRVFILEQPV